MPVSSRNRRPWHFPGVLKKLKLRLQFTGWLQYLPLATGAAVCFLLAAPLALVGAILPAGIFGMLGGLFLATFLFDLATVKWNLRPCERLPKRRDDWDLFDLLKARRSCRSFQNRLLTGEHRAELMAWVDRLARPAGHPYFEPSSIRLEYVSAPLTVWPVVGAKEFLVAIAPSEYRRAAIVEVGYVLQKVVIRASRMGLATCWIGPGADQASIQRHLGDRFDPRLDHVVCVCAVGYPSAFVPLVVRLVQRVQSGRLPPSSLFFVDARFSEPLPLDKPPFGRFGRTYEICQWSPSPFNEQTTRCVGVAAQGGGVPHVERMDFYASTESRYYAAIAVGIWCANWEAGSGALGFKGCFCALPPRARGGPGAGILPRYDLSWIPDPNQGPA
jgi:nitroreductase